MQRTAISILFAATIFIGAFLLFEVQPLIGKYILPWFGGTPAVWTTCMLFFQVMLLVGYAYAHASVKYLQPRAQLILHLMLLGLAVAMLPIVPGTSWMPPDPQQPILRILALLTISVGLPYVVLAATGPLIQSWYARVRLGESPYRLYALSNTASLLALLSYPFFIEPQFSRTTQAASWGWMLIGFAILCATTAIVSWRVGKNPHPGPLPAYRKRGKRIILWLILPASASALLLAMTNKICQDIAVVPLLWVLPLAIYLLSFVICFDNPRWYRREIFMPLLALALAAMCWVLHPTSEDIGLLLQVEIYSAALFVCCMVCHGELYSLRPEPAGLTMFYLLIAAGGAIGGIAVAVVAPLAFNGFYELHVALAGIAVLALIVLRIHQIIHNGKIWLLLIGGLLSLAVALWIDATSPGNLKGALLAERSRNFYGVLSVYDENSQSFIENYRLLRHGTIAHGGQFIAPQLRARPTAYYGPSTGVGLTLAHLPRTGPLRVGVIGLGVGTVLTYAQPGDEYAVYEINPEVLRIAKENFGFINECKGHVQTYLGDARLSLERQSTQNFDVLIVDAFSGDAIPVHLLTSECLQLYQRHLRPGGVIAIHISNQHLDLAPVVIKLAEHLRLSYTHLISEKQPSLHEYVARWMLLSSNESFLNSDAIKNASSPVVGDNSAIRLWTDDDTNLFQILN